MNENKHYIRLDINNNIIFGFSDAFITPIVTDICINLNGGRQFEINGIINPNILDNNLIPNYKYNNNVIEELTITDKNLYIPNLPKSNFEILQETVDALVITSLGG